MQIDVRVSFERFNFNYAKEIERGINVANTRTG